MDSTFVSAVAAFAWPSQHFEEHESLRAAAEPPGAPADHPEPPPAAQFPGVHQTDSNGVPGAALGRPARVGGGQPGSH